MGFDPITMALLGAASSAANVAATNKQAQAQAEAAVSATNLAYKQQEMEQEEIRQETGVQLTAEALKRVEERGKVRAAQAESGVAGISSARELANTYLQEALTTGTIISKEEARLRTSGLHSQQSFLSGVSSVNQATASMYSPLTAALTIGAGAASAYATAGGFGPVKQSTSLLEGPSIPGKVEPGYYDWWA